MSGAPIDKAEAAFELGSFADLKAKYDGKEVAVFCNNGAMLRGVVRFTEGQWLNIEQRTGNNTIRMAMCNLAYIVSIATGTL